MNVARLVLILAAIAGGMPLLLTPPSAQAQVTSATLPVTKGRYRLPYANGTDVRANNDHRSHPAARNRMDLGGRNGGPYTIVAAADGWLRIIEDDNTLWCPDVDPGDPDPCAGVANCCEVDDASCNSGCRNNYIWIEHPNGEWSKYTHVRTGSVAANGHQTGDFVQAGEALGIEGQVGFAGGPHLHFEVALPIHGIDSISSSGFLTDDDDPATDSFPDTDNNPNDYNRQNRVVAFCTGGASGIWLAGTQVAAANCTQSCVAVLSPNAAAAAGSVTHGQANLVTPTANFRVNAGAGRGVLAQTRVTLQPGFVVQEDGFFVASIGACDAPGSLIATPSTATATASAQFDGLGVLGVPPVQFEGGLPSCYDPGSR
jgi:hypothetical protein